MKEIDKIETIILTCDLLIVGGGAAGCQAAIHAKELNTDADVLIVEKANIERSGCLAAGVNAINAYINDGETPESFVNYVKKESSGLIREDLTYTFAERLNKMTQKLEEYGLLFKKDANGKYEPRGRASVKINGENIKPVLADAVRKSGAKVLNKVNAIDFIVKNGKVKGIYGISVYENKFYIINAKAVICATGGAAGVYKPNNGGAARHKMWYSPFNTGAGLAMGIRAGAEMTTFEMRFIALRTKETLSPTGTIAQGVNAKQINSNNEDYMENYKEKTTPWRLYATLMENNEGRGPCYLDTTGIDESTVSKLKEAYLNMSPAIILKWKDDNINPSITPIEICGSEPYINGGHGQAGYWIDIERKSTLEGLYAAGDIAGGAPKKYVTGSMAEGEIAAENALKYINDCDLIPLLGDEATKDRIYKPLYKSDAKFKSVEIEERMQKVMDEYAGGISTDYTVNEKKLLIAKRELEKLEEDLTLTGASNYYELVQYHETAERILIAKVVVEHLIYRKETRWKCYQERSDYPEIDNENWMKFVNSVYDCKNGKVEILERTWPNGGAIYGS